MTKYHLQFTKTKQLPTAPQITVLTSKLQVDKCCLRAGLQLNAQFTSGRSNCSNSVILVNDLQLTLLSVGLHIRGYRSGRGDQEGGYLEDIEGS